MSTSELFRNRFKHGVLSDAILEALFDNGFIYGVSKKYINAASVNLPLSSEAYRLDRSFLPLNKLETVRELIQRGGGRRIDLPHILEPGRMYLVRVEGHWKLPRGVKGYSNPRSSAGRIHLFCRTMADKMIAYDSLDPGWSGELWVQIMPKTFSVIIDAGYQLSQLRLIHTSNFLDPLFADMVIARHGLVFSEEGKKYSVKELTFNDHKILITLDVRREMGWVAKKTATPIDFAARYEYEPDNFFEPITPRDGEFTLVKDAFYILAQRERTKVPLEFSAELSPYNARGGELRVHYAGFVDPGWGCGPDGNASGRPLTLEVVTGEDITVRHGQYVGRLTYEWNIEPPHKGYDTDEESAYINQLSGPRLSKHFKQ